MSNKTRNIIIVVVLLLFALWEFYIIGYSNGYKDGAKAMVELLENTESR